MVSGINEASDHETDLNRVSCSVFDPLDKEQFLAATVRLLQNEALGIEMARRADTWLERRRHEAPYPRIVAAALGPSEHAGAAIPQVRAMLETS